MKIKPSNRVSYRNNPLVEVLCQIRFDRILKLQAGLPQQFQEAIASQFPHLNEEKLASFQLQIGGSTLAGPAESASFPAIYHFSSDDRERRVSVCADFFTFSCRKYEDWGKFSTEFYEILKVFSDLHPPTALRRVGLRYKDLIEREKLGLDGVDWRELLAPFVAGAFAAEDLFESPLTVEAEGRVEQTSQSTLRLDDCDVLLQSALLRSSDSPPKHAFLIDADFFHDAQTRPVQRERLGESLEGLHKSANALFRACLKPKLHDALGPTPL